RLDPITAGIGEQPAISFTLTCRFGSLSVWIDSHRAMPRQILQRKRDCARPIGPAQRTAHGGGAYIRGRRGRNGVSADVRTNEDRTVRLDRYLPIALVFAAALLRQPCASSTSGSASPSGAAAWCASGAALGHRPNAACTKAPR